MGQWVFELLDIKMSAQIKLIRLSAKITLIRLSAKITLIRLSAKITLIRLSAYIIHMTFNIYNSYDFQHILNFKGDLINIKPLIVSPSIGSIYFNNLRSIS